jgi:hypothetical protein
MRQKKHVLPVVTFLSSLVGLAGTGICLAKAGRTYIVYTLAGGEVRVDLKQAPGVFIAQWFNPCAAERTPKTTMDGGQERGLSAPDANDRVLLLKDRRG